MAPTTTTPPKTVYSTAGTVSAPIDLEAPQGEHTSVTIGGGKGRKVVKPKVKVTLTSLTPNNSGTLRKLNSVVIPIVYSEKFYKDVLDSSLDDINKLIYYADIPVGAICCKFENLASSSKDKPPTMVILTLAILAPYRSLGLGTALLQNALKNAIHPITPPPPVPSKDKTNTRSSLTVTPRKVVNRAIAHVQVGNDSAKRFYERLGFVATETVENYYSKMEPRGAVLMVCEDIAKARGETPNGTA